jgi:hypothetical protein
MALQRAALQSTPSSRGSRVLLRMLRTVFFDSYRPELHYMRGPGPKWREKRNRLQPVKTSCGPTPPLWSAQEVPTD